MPEEVPLWLTPNEAASGVIRVVDLPTGSVNLRIPPVRDNNLIKVSTATGETTFIRIRVIDAQPQPGPRRAFTGSPLARPLFILVALCVLLAVVVLLTRQGDSSPSASGPGAGATAPASSGTGDDTGHPDSATHDPGTGPALTTPPVAPSLYRAGTCLDGTIPDSTTPVSVSDVDVVACSSADAHYRVIQTFHGTTDMSRCRGNSDTQYSFSSERTLNGRTISSVVYCLVGLGSYAR
ncbi:LppU/SCO3897 family protein [Streptomyces netropsis]